MLFFEKNALGIFTLIMKNFVFAFLNLTIQVGLAQSNVNLYFSVFKNDSLLWDSPISAKLAKKEGIKKVEFLENVWERNCNGCPDIARDPKRFTCKYTKKKIVFSYDSLGFPVRIMLIKYSDFQEVFEFKCLNYYDLKGLLLKSELYSRDQKTDSLSLAGLNIRKYDNENLLEVSEIYAPFYEGILRERRYVYDIRGNIEQVSEDAGTHRLIDGRRLYYDTNNRIIQSGDTPNETVLKYNSSGQLTRFYEMDGRRTIKKARRINLGNYAAGFVYTTVWQLYPFRVYFKRRTLSSATEIKDNETYLWNYDYYEKRILASCNVVDVKTGLLIRKLNNYLCVEKPKYKHRYSRFRLFKTPGKNFRIEFPSQSNVVEYNYFRQ